MNRLVIATSFLVLSGAALAQQASGPPTADQVTDLQLQLQLTQQQLAGTNQNLVASQSQMIRVGRQLNEAVSENAKKDGQIKDLEAQIASSLKSTKAATPEPKGEAEHMPPELPVPAPPAATDTSK